MIPKREGIMMCAPFSIRRFEQWGSAYAQTKLNGERCRVTWSSTGKVNMRSSYNKEIVSVPHIYQTLSDIPYRDLELDSELYKHGMDLRKIQSIVSRTVNLHPEFETMEIHFFDEVDDRPQNQRFESFYHKRKEIKNKKKQKINIVQTEVVDSLDGVYGELAKYMDLGFEGIILRKVDGVYQRDLHSTQIMKLKPRKDDHYIIIGVTEKKNLAGEPQNTLGAFICKARDVDEEFRVGTGKILTDAGRQKYWDNPPIGKTLHIKYQELTPNGIPYTPVAFDILED
jgi:ATP-dependent DNA ligase